MANPRIPFWQKPITKYLKDPQISSAAIDSAEQKRLIRCASHYRHELQQRYTTYQYLRRHGDVIYICDADSQNYYAYDIHRDQEIGHLMLELNEQNEYFLIEIAVGFCQGVGVQLIKHANSQTNQQLKISLGQAYNSRYRLLPETRELVQVCLDGDIIHRDQLVHDSIPTPSFALSF